MQYLIYKTKEDANARADQEGQLLKFAHWTQGRGTRWLTAPAPTAEGNYALDVTNYELSDVEKTETVPSYKPLPSEDE